MGLYMLKCWYNGQNDGSNILNIPDICRINICVCQNNSFKIARCVTSIWRKTWCIENFQQNICIKIYWMWFLVFYFRQNIIKTGEISEWGQTLQHDRIQRIPPDDGETTGDWHQHGRSDGGIQVIIILIYLINILTLTVSFLLQDFW